MRPLYECVDPGDFLQNEHCAELILIRVHGEKYLTELAFNLSRVPDLGPSIVFAMDVVKSLLAVIPSQYNTMCICTSIEYLICLTCEAFQLLYLNCKYMSTFDILCIL